MRKGVEAVVERKVSRLVELGLVTVVREARGRQSWCLGGWTAVAPAAVRRSKGLRCSMGEWWRGGGEGTLQARFRYMS